MMATKSSRLGGETEIPPGRNGPGSELGVPSPPFCETGKSRASLAFVVAKTLLGTGQATGVPHAQLLDRGQGPGVNLPHPESAKTTGSPISEKERTHLRKSHLLT